jgi:hypothetical protein
MGIYASDAMDTNGPPGVEFLINDFDSSLDNLVVEQNYPVNFVDIIFEIQNNNLTTLSINIEKGSVNIMEEAIIPHNSKDVTNNLRIKYLYIDIPLKVKSSSHKKKLRYPLKC